MIPLFECESGWLGFSDRVSITRVQYLARSSFPRELPDNSQLHHIKETRITK
jgi:hypothetical protein